MPEKLGQRNPSTKVRRTVSNVGQLPAINLCCLLPTLFSHSQQYSGHVSSGRDPSLRLETVLSVGLLRCRSQIDLRPLRHRGGEPSCETSSQLKLAPVTHQNIGRGAVYFSISEIGFDDSAAGT